MNASKAKKAVALTAVVCMLALCFASAPLSADTPPMRGLQDVNCEHVQLQGGFWGPRLKTHHEVTVPHALNCLEKNGHVTNFDKAAGVFDGAKMRVASKNHLPQGVRFIGTGGWVHITRAGLKTNPESLLREKIGPDEIHLPRPAGDHRQGHRRDFLDCVRTRAKTISPVDIAHRAATVCHLANIAMIRGAKVEWDPTRQQIIDDPTAARMLSKPARSPWHL